MEKMKYDVRMYISALQSNIMLFSCAHESFGKRERDDSSIPIVPS